MRSIEVMLLLHNSAEESEEGAYSSALFSPPVSYQLGRGGEPLWLLGSARE
jgi:hypothetical protein